METLQSLYALQQLPKTAKWPVLFLGHGSPMNAINPNGFSPKMQSLGQELRQKLGTPAAIMVVSAHWETRGTWVSVNPKPEVIYDFGGFPKALYEQQYPAKGSPLVAKATQELAANGAHKIMIHEHATMGLDHGAWTVLKFLFPEANAPVYQLSLDHYASGQQHLNLGEDLRGLRERGVLIVASGNVVHNLGLADFRNPDAKPHDWALEADAQLDQLIQKRNWAKLSQLHQLSKAVQMGAPTPEHYYPLLYTVGMADAKEEIRTVIQGFQHGSISMRAIIVGA